VNASLKALALPRPDASLVVARVKRFATLPERTDHRGLVAIYALETDTHGSVIAIAELVDVHPIHDDFVTIVDSRDRELDRCEIRMGTWRTGFHAWEFAILLRIEPPIACNGGVGLFDLPKECAQALLRILEDLRLSREIVVKKKTTRKKTAPHTEPVAAAPETATATAEAAPASSRPFEVELVKLEALDLSFGNLRSPSSNGLDELASSIREHGVQHAILVRPVGDALQVIFGFRRVEASKRVGLEEIPARIRVLSDTEASTLQIVENDQREDADPFRAADAIAKLREQGLSQEDVARELGHKPGWVARREALSGIIPELRARLAKRPDAFGVSHLEVFARMSAESQEKFLEEEFFGVEPGQEIDPEAHEYSVPTVRALEHMVAEYCHELRRAPWALDDALLVPEAGACSVCPHNSARVPGLFEDVVAEGSDGDAHCRNHRCWGEKVQAFARQRAAELKKEHGGKVALVSTQYSADHPRGVLQSHQYDKAKKQDAEGAIPAVVLDGPTAGETIWIVPRGKVSDETKPPKAEKKSKPKGPLTRAQLERELAKETLQLEERRAAWRREQLGKAIDELLGKPGRKHLAARTENAAALLSVAAERRRETPELLVLRFLAAADESFQSSDALPVGAFDSPPLGRLFEYALREMTGDRSAGWSERLADVLLGGDTWKGIEAESVLKIRTPKSLTSLERQLEALPEPGSDPVPAKRKTKKKKALAGAAARQAEL
jgi:ParB/RepB/Spo0J family partition protein